MILSSWIQTTNFISGTFSGQYSAIKKRTEYLGMPGNLIRNGEYMQMIFCHNEPFVGEAMMVYNSLLDLASIIIFSLQIWTIIIGS